MTLTFPANGSTVTDATASPGKIFSEITSDDDAYWGAMVYVPAAFTGSDAVTLRWAIYDIAGATITGKYVYKKDILGDQSTEPAIYFPPIAGKRYRLLLERTAGTDRTFTWYIIKQTG